jgi:hypothetical protein
MHNTAFPLCKCGRVQLAMVTTMSVSAAEIHVMSGGAPKEVFALLTPKFEQQPAMKWSSPMRSSRNYAKN